MRDLTQRQFETACRRRGFRMVNTVTQLCYGPVWIVTERDAENNRLFAYRDRFWWRTMRAEWFPSRRAALAAFIRAAEKQEKRT